MNVYIDFDRTMFNSDDFLDDLEMILSRYNISQTLFYEYGKRIKDNGFNPYSILKLMSTEISFDDEIYNEIDKLIMKSDSYLYDDVISFLQTLKNNGYKLTLLTKGNREYQSMKIKSSKVLDYFDDLIITLKHKGELELNYKESIFIDDNPVEVESIIKRNPMKMIRIKRDGALYNSREVNGDILIVRTFNEIIDKNLL